MPDAEEQKQRYYLHERSADNKPEQIAFQSPGFAGGVVRAVRLSKAQLVFCGCAH